MKCAERLLTRARRCQILFFDDTEAWKGLPERLQGMLAANPEWYDEASGMTDFRR